MTPESPASEARIRERIRAFLGCHLRGSPPDDGTDIFSAGFVNSLFAMQLVLFVEKEFAITIASEDLELAHFRSVDALTALVARKRAAAG